jgi:ABC-2 type transport system permease protein
MPSEPRGSRRAAWTVYKREIKQYLQSPATYVALILFFVLSGAMFTDIVKKFVQACTEAQTGATPKPDAMPLNVTESVVTPLFLVLNFVLLFIVPMLTMRLVAEEKRSGTFELLVSTPLGGWDILLGKFFAALTIGAGMLAICVVYPLICAFYSNPEGPVVVSCYLGLLFVIISYTAFGLFASALSDSQVIAGVLSFVGLLVFYMVGTIFDAGRLGLIGGALSIRQHSENFTKGVISLVDVSFFLLFSFFFLFLTAQILDARRWRT